MVPGGTVHNLTPFVSAKSISRFFYWLQTNLWKGFEFCLSGCVPQLKFDCCVTVVDAD